MCRCSVDSLGAGDEMELWSVNVSEDQYLLKGRRGSRIGQREKWNCITVRERDSGESHPTFGPKSWTLVGPWMRSVGAGCPHMAQLGLSHLRADADLKLTAKTEHLHVRQSRRFVLQRIQPFSIYLSKHAVNAYFLPSQVMNHLTVVLKTEMHSYALSYSLSIGFVGMVFML